MKRWLLSVLPLLPLTLQAEISTSDLPFAPEEAAVIERLIEREREDVVGKSTAVPGNVSSLFAWLKGAPQTRIKP